MSNSVIDKVIKNVIRDWIHNEITQDTDSRQLAKVCYMLEGLRECEWVKIVAVGELVICDETG